MISGMLKLESSLQDHNFVLEWFLSAQHDDKERIMFATRDCTKCPSSHVEIDELAQRIICDNGHIEQVSFDEMNEMLNETGWK